MVGMTFANRAMKICQMTRGDNAPPDFLKAAALWDVVAGHLTNAVAAGGGDMSREAAKKLLKNAKGEAAYMRKLAAQNLSIPELERMGRPVAEKDETVRPPVKLYSARTKGSKGGGGKRG